MNKIDLFFEKADLDDALLGHSYQERIEEGGPDIGIVTGAPNQYEGSIRSYGGLSDFNFNWVEGNNLEGDILIIPEDERKSNKFIEDLEHLNVDIMTPDIDLYTTADDFSTARDISGSSDSVHVYTSDYHSAKADMLGKEILSDPDVYTFGFETERSKRENLLIQNRIAQTAHGFWERYNL